MTTQPATDGQSKAWECARCGQMNSDWAQECGRCETSPPARDRDSLLPPTFSPQRFFLNAPKQADGTCFVLDTDFQLAMAEVERLRRRCELLRSHWEEACKQYGSTPEPGEQRDIYKDAIDSAREADLFEDGCAADLSEAGVTTVTDAYMRGRADCLAEIDFAVEMAKPTTKEEKL